MPMTAKCDEALCPQLQKCPLFPEMSNSVHCWTASAPLSAPAIPTTNSTSSKASNIAKGNNNTCEISLTDVEWEGLHTISNMIWVLAPQKHLSFLLAHYTYPLQQLTPYKGSRKTFVMLVPEREIQRAPFCPLGNRLSTHSNPMSFAT